jgi:hypothetical protein
MPATAREMTAMPNFLLIAFIDLLSGLMNLPGISRRSAFRWGILY